MDSYQPPNQYMQSSPMVSQTPAIRTQSLPNMDLINNLRASLKTTQSHIYCPYCKKEGETNVELECNGLNIACCILTGGILWFFHQLCRSKDYNCNNAKQSCSRCNAVLSEYKAC